MRTAAIHNREVERFIAEGIANLTSILNEKQNDKVITID